MYKKPELLAPAGSFDGMRAAINAGADAVYMGGIKFGARAYANNPDEKGMLEAIEFCHLRDRKIYLTVNTLLKEAELEKELYDYLLPYYEAGLDAVIVQDIGVMEFIGKNFPGLDIHISTQTSITSSKGVEGLVGLLTYPDSVTRVVPARELNLQELKKFKEETSIELEVFIQGALCYCYSGQCLLSSLAGGRSGNRGRCAQPCRRLYELDNVAGYETGGIKGYFLSPKDMCTLGVLGELIDIGIDSFKIEGRMKSEEYAAGVVSAYREYIDSFLDENAHFNKRDLQKNRDLRLSELAENGTRLIKELYNRGGFNEGYLFEHNGQEMMSPKRNGHYGVCIGEVTKTEGRKAYIKTSEPVKKGDVLEIRDAKKDTAIYEFTAGGDITKGTVFSVLTMKDRLAAKGKQVYRTKNDVLLKELRAKYIEENSKIPVMIYLTAKIGKPLSLKMETAFSPFYSQVTGREVQAAINSKSTKEELAGILSKLGNTEFYASEVNIEADEGIFISVQELKKCRRECAETLRSMKLNSFRRTKNENVPAQAENRPENSLPSVSKDQKGPDNALLYANEENSSVKACISVRTPEQLKWVLSSDKTGFISDIYLDMTGLVCKEDNCLKRIKTMIESAESLFDMAAQKEKRLLFKTPRIIRDAYYDEVKEFCEHFKEKTSFLAANYESIALLSGIGAEYRADYNIYCFNKTAKHLLHRRYTLPVELNEAELSQVAENDGELIVYGLLPAMVSAQCVHKTVTGQCGKHPDIRLKDEKGYTFRTHSVCAYCYNYVYNSAVQCLFHREESVLKTGCGRIRAELTFEDESETALIVRALEGFSLKNTFPTEIMGLKLTNGHFNRGVE